MPHIIEAPVLNQIPLFEYVDEDDTILLNSPHAEWFRILHFFPWREYCVLGASYYNALYDFNTSKQIKSDFPDKNIDESKEEGRQRLLFNRRTIDNSKSVLFEIKPVELSKEIPVVLPRSISPGVVPSRAGGKKPKCFFALFKSFFGVSLMGHPPEPEVVQEFLLSNPSFARVCGFDPKDLNHYSYKNIPSLRKLEQFDQIMTEYGLWNQTKINEVKKNLQEGVITQENELVGDTTHYYAYSGFETVSYTDKKGKKKTKSQSKITKNCNCKDQINCPHEWELTDDGAGTIVKSHKKMIWGHKASILGFPVQGIPLDAAAVSDAATHDGETFYPHVKILFQNIPEIKANIDRVLYDSACDSQDLKDNFKKDLGIELKASLNPRRKKTVTENLPKGMLKLTAHGNLVCNSEIEMDYQGMRHEREQFIYMAPVNKENISVCEKCALKDQCCPTAVNGRVVNIPFNMLPHIDQNDPPMAKRFKAIMTRRPSVERMIKRLKCDMSDDRLTKRNNKSFQAYLDKTLIAFHILLRQ